MDNLSFHKNKQFIKLVEDSTNKVIYIPPYSPDFNPIEQVFSCIKREYRRRNIYRKAYVQNIKTSIASTNTLHINKFYQKAFNKNLNLNIFFARLLM